MDEKQDRQLEESREQTGRCPRCVMAEYADATLLVFTAN
jgi:hypothetical protein